MVTLKETALDQGHTDRISPTRDYDLQSPVSHGHDVSKSCQQKVGPQSFEMSSHTYVLMLCC